MSQDHRMTRFGMEERNLARLNPVLALNRLPAGMVGWKKNVQIDQYGAIQVTCVSGRGHVVPHGIDADVIFALTTLYHLQGRPTDGTVRVSVAGLCHAVGLALSSPTYTRVRESLQRLRHVSYRVIDCWAHPTKQGKWNWRSLDFGILSALEEEDSDLPIGSVLGRYTPLTLLKITLSAQLLQSISVENIRLIDLDFYSTLEQPLARILYRTLEEQRNLPNSDGKAFRTPLMAWGDHLGMRSLVNFASSIEGTVGNVNDFVVPETHVMGPDRIRRALEPAHKELQEKGYFKVEYIGRGKDQRVDYTFGIPTQPVDYDLVAMLTQRGITAIMADKHARTYSRDLIEQAVLKFDERKKAGYIIKNPGGFLSDLLGNPGKYPDPVARAGAERVLNSSSKVSSPALPEPVAPPTDSDGAVRGILSSLVARGKITPAEEAVVMAMHAQGRVTSLEVTGLVTSSQPADVIGRWVMRPTA